MKKVRPAVVEVKKETQEQQQPVNGSEMLGSGVDRCNRLLLLEEERKRKKKKTREKNKRLG